MTRQEVMDLTAQVFLGHVPAMVTCPDCTGTGERSQDECGRCFGSGVLGTYTLNGEVVCIHDFIEDNGFAMPDIELIAALPVDGEIYYGGGAAARSCLRRVA